jgi:hypothetical protein
MRGQAAALLVRTWLLGTLACLALLAIWAFAPVLLFVALVLAGLGAASALVIVLARALESRRHRPDGD